jgi:hypothetical protein
MRDGKIARMYHACRRGAVSSGSHRALAAVQASSKSFDNFAFA